MLLAPLDNPVTEAVKDILLFVIIKASLAAAAVSHGLNIFLDLLERLFIEAALVSQVLPEEIGIHPKAPVPVSIAIAAVLARKTTNDTHQLPLNRLGLTGHRHKRIPELLVGFFMLHEKIVT